MEGEKVGIFVLGSKIGEMGFLGSSISFILFLCHGLSSVSAICFCFLLHWGYRCIQSQDAWRSVLTCFVILKTIPPNSTSSTIYFDDPNPFNFVGLRYVDIPRKKKLIRLIGYHWTFVAI